LLHVVGVDTWLGPAQEGVPEQIPLGYWQVPIPSQPVAPHEPPVMQGAMQQLPVPVTPQTLLAQSVGALHDWPAAIRHPAPLPTQVYVLEAHKVEVPGVQDVAQALPLHPRLELHAMISAPLAQLPLPSHCEAVVIIPLTQETTLEQAVPAAAFRQAPVLVAHAPVCPQGAFVTGHVVTQQTPLVPQTPLVHWSLAAQEPPEAAFATQRPPVQ
jgi:hypothetical protein